METPTDFERQLSESVRELEDELEGERAHGNRLAEVVRLLLSNLDERQHVIITAPNVAMISLGDIARGQLALHRERRDMTTED